MILAMSYVNLLRHIGAKGARRRDCAIKYFQWIGVLLSKNIYTIKSIFAFDKATRQLKAGTFVWGYDNNIASANLVYYNPTKEPISNGKKPTYRKNMVKRTRDGTPKSGLCYHYGEGGCQRTQDECHFKHQCDSCKTGPNDRHDLVKCSVKHLFQRPGGKSKPKTTRG